MRIFKKSMAIFLGALIVAGASPLERLFVSAEATSKKEVELLDLSDYDAGTELIKGTTPLPYNMNWGITDDYDGKREVVYDSVAKKNVLKLNFNIPATANDRALDNIKNYEFVLDIPEAYRPYLYSVKMEIDNQTVDSDYKWTTKDLYYWLSFTDGTNYAINNDKPKLVEKRGDSSYESVITEMGKVSSYYYSNYCEKWDSTKWSDSDKASINKVRIPFTVPTSDLTDYYVIVKSVKIVLNCTDEEFVVAQKAAQKAASAIIDDYESGTIGKDYKTNSDGSEILKDAVHGGKYAVRHTRPSGEIYSGSVVVTLDSRSVKSDGISFYVNNSNRQGTTAPSLRCFIVEGKEPIAQKDLTISKQGSYLKYTVLFDDLGELGTDKWSGGTNTGKKLTEEQKAAITQLEIRFSGTTKGDTFDFDDFRYEKKPVQSDGSYVNNASNNGYQIGTRAFGAIFTAIANATNVKTGFVIWTEKLFNESRKTELDLSCVDSTNNASALDISYNGQPEKLYGILRNNKDGKSVTDAYAQTVFVARPYITYTDADGKEQTVYGDMITSNATK